MDLSGQSSTQIPFRLRMLLPVVCVFIASSVFAQPPNRRLTKQQAEMQKRMQERMKEIAANQPELPRDPQLLSLHKEFITKAEKLAGEYERKKQFDRAREVYESLTRLVPKYKNAEDGLQRMISNQAQDRKLATVSATSEWQDSGAQIQEGMPVKFEVKGTWKVVLETGPEGVKIPDAMKPRDGRIKLGTLIGVIASSPADLAESRPFILTNGKEMIANKSGRLFMRMYDIDPSDNEGKMYVLIRSSFGKASSR